jgi:hypothetical protein
MAGVSRRRMLSITSEGALRIKKGPCNREAQAGVSAV